ncbi:MAG: response regulator [Deltaproteobacteria bacterium]|nr:response regulator [Deltaproteobacteria bacterium]
MTATSKRILLVDDEQLVRDVCSELLSIEGYRVDTASDGLDALAMINKAGYDLIVLDVNMPNRFLFITGDLYGEGETLEFFCKGASVLKKPFTRQDFLDSIRQILSRPAKPIAPQ